MSKVDPELEATIADAIPLLRMLARYCNPGSYLDETPGQQYLQQEVDSVLRRLFAYQPRWYSNPRIRAREEGDGQQQRSDQPAAPDGSGD